MAKKKKKNKQPAKKRNKGTLIDLTNRNISETIEKEECEEILKQNIIKGKVTNYRDEICTIEFMENKEINEITKKINNDNLSWIKTVYFVKKFNKKKKQDEITNIYASFKPSFIENIDIENLNLKINKFPFFEIKDNNEIKFIYKDKYCFDKQESYIDSYYKNINKLNYCFSNSITYTTSFYLSIGSEDTVYETSIKLHHTYGIPYIPASAIKGSFRSYIINKYFDNEEKTALDKDDWFVDIFGNENKQGNVIFFDAFSKDAKIQKDIMNPHYPDYYDGKKPPTDDQNPRPINFLVVTGEFQFLVGVKNNFTINPKNEKISILNFVERELKNSLQNFGIGAKTAVGYGYFE